MSAVADNAMRASIAYRDAVEDYGNFVDATMRQYGWTMPDASGEYSVLGAQDAFDPDRVIQFDSAGKPVFGAEDAQRLAAMGASGQYGTTGLFAQTAQAGAAEEAGVQAGVRARGLGARSGLARQAELAAETAALQNIGQVSADFFGGIMSKYGGLGKLYQDIATGEATDEAIRAAQASQNVGLSNPVAPPVMPKAAPAAAPEAAPAPASGKPTGKGRMYERRGKWQYMGDKRGWVKT